MAHPFDVLEGENFISLTTIRKNGTPVPTPVWFVREGDALYIFTNAKSGKVKRLRHTQDVTIAPCKANGDLKGVEPFRAQGEIIQEADEARRADQALVRKYGMQKRLFMWMGRLRRQEAAYLKITPSQ